METQGAEIVPKWKISLGRFVWTYFVNCLDQDKKASFIEPTANSSKALEQLSKNLGEITAPTIDRVTNFTNINGTTVFKISGDHETNIDLTNYGPNSFAVAYRLSLFKIFGKYRVQIPYIAGEIIVPSNFRLYTSDKWLVGIRPMAEIIGELPPQELYVAASTGEIYEKYVAE